MISFFRRFLTSPLALGLLALVLIAFVVTGIRTGAVGGGPAQGSLARVGGADVTEAQFLQIWRAKIAEIQQQNPKISAEELARSGAVDQLLDQMTADKALQVFGQKQGIAAGDPLVDAELKSIPAFQNAGQFDQTKYEFALQRLGRTDKSVRDEIAGDLIRRQLRAPVGTGASVPEGAALPYAGLILEARQGLIGLVPAAALTGVPAPTEAQLATFYAQHRAQFTIPERRSFRYALIDPAALAPPVSDADVAAYYKAHAAQYAATERRRLAQAVVADEATARRLAAAAKGAQGFDAAAQAIGRFAQSDTEIGVRSEAEFAAATSAAVARAAFAAAAGGVTDPVKSDFGWHVVKVEAVVPGQGRSLDAARPEIVAAIRAERGSAKLAQIVPQVRAALTKGTGFADAAKRFGLTTVTTPPLTATGGGAPGFVLQPDLAPLLAAAFQVDPGEAPTVEELKGRAVLFETAQVVPPTLPKLAEIAPQATALWTGDARARQAFATAQAIAAEVNGPATMVAAMGKRGLNAPQPVNLRRIDLMRPNAQVPPPIGFLFTLPEGATRALSGGPAGSYVVEAVKVTPGDPRTAPQVVQGIRKQFADLAANELAEQFARAAAQDVGVKRDAAAIAGVRARLSGGADTARP